MGEGKPLAQETIPDTGASPVAGRTGGRGFSYKGKTLLSGVDPQGRADRIAETVEVTDRTLYLCPSPLHGYGLERLLVRLAQIPDSAVLCIEAEPELFALSLENLGEALKGNPRLLLTDCIEADGLCALVRREWGSRTFKHIKTVRLNGGWQLHPALYDTLAQILQKEVALDWGNAITLTRLGRRYIRNALRNIARMPNCPSLDGGLSFGGEPVLVFGAGPSLDGTLDALSARFGETLLDPKSRPFRIVCVDTCLWALKARGVTPDLAVVLESQHWNLEDFVGLSGWKVPVAMDLSALPRSGGVLSGGLCFFFTPWTQLRIFDRLRVFGLLPTTLPPLGSVGLNAVAIALRLTRGAVITAGLDFSFSLDLFHARSSPGHNAKLRRHNRFTGLLNADAVFGGAVFAATSKDGTTVLSSPALRNYRDLFEREFAAFSEGSTPPRLFDIAGKGLPLGIKPLPHSTAFDLLATGTPIVASGAMPPSRAIEKGETVALAEKLMAFNLAERDRLLTLRAMLTGNARMDHQMLDTLIDECDYLWAHFPDYAARKRRPPRAELEAGTDTAVSFLKRLRVEIDPFLGLFTDHSQPLY